MRTLPPSMLAMAASSTQGGVVTTVVLDALEADVVVRLVRGANHAQALGSREGPEPAAEVDGPGRTEVARVGVHGLRARHDVEPLGVLRQVVDLREQCRRLAGSLERGDDLHGYRSRAFACWLSSSTTWSSGVGVDRHAAVGMDLEVQVRRAALRVAGVAHEPDDVAGLDQRRLR